MKADLSIAALMTALMLSGTGALAQQGVAADGGKTEVPAGLPSHTAPTAPDGTSPSTSTTGQVDVQNKPDLGATTPAPAQSTAPGAAPAAPESDAAAPATAAAQALAAGLVAPEGYARVADLSAVSAESLTGAELRSVDGKDVGKVTGLAPGGTAVVADIGGFLGLGARSVLLEADQIGIFRNDADKYVVLSVLSEEVLKGLPEYKAAN